MKLGDDMDDSVVEEKTKAQRPEHCALLVYTVSFAVHKELTVSSYPSFLVLKYIGSLGRLEIQRVSCLATTM